MKVSLDTNILVYAQGVDDAGRQSIAENYTQMLSVEDTFVSAQALGELFNVLVRRGRGRDVAKQAIEFWRATFTLVETTGELLSHAVGLAAESKLQIWDAIILAAAAEAHCDILLSEDFQDGFAWRGVTVVNPFAENPHKMLTKLLRG